MGYKTEPQNNCHENENGNGSMQSEIPRGLWMALRKVKFPAVSMGEETLKVDLERQWKALLQVGSKSCKSWKYVMGKSKESFICLVLGFLIEHQ